MLYHETINIQYNIHDLKKFDNSFMDHLIHNLLVSLFASIIHQILSYVRVHEPVATSQTFFMLVVQCQSVSTLIFYGMAPATDILITEIPFRSLLKVLSIVIDGNRLNMTLTSEHIFFFEGNIEITMIASDFGQNGIEREFFLVLMCNIMLLMDAALLTIVASTVEVELIGKKEGDGELYPIDYNCILFGNDGITMGRI